MDRHTIRLGVMLLVLVLLATGWPVLWRILSRGTAADLLSSGAGVVLVALFLAGLAVRTREGLGRSGDRGRRRREALRRERVAVRQPAEEIPVVANDQEGPEDPDPALAWGRDR